ncbi:unnamed protein product [Ascophyllum nodosum]
MKFAKHVAKAMTFSDPEWLPFWINYRFLKKLLPHKVVSSAPAGPVATAAPKSAPAPSAAVARSAPALDHYDHVRDAAGMSTGNPTGSADRRWQPRKQKDGIIQSTSLRTMGAATSTTAATSTASAAAAKSRASWGVSQGLRPCPQQPRPQRGCTRLPSRRHASSSSARVATQEGERRDCVVEGGGRDDVGGGRGNVQKEELAAANANRRAFAINSRTCGRPTCCSRLSSGCGAAAIPAAAALGLCSPATAASAGVLRPKHQLHHQRQQNQRLNHHPPRQAPQQQQREAGGGEGERRGEGRGGHWKAAPALQCPFFLELLREIYKCRVFFLQNEDELKARTMRLQFALNQLKNPELSRLSSVKGFHVKLMKACVKFYRDALLLEDFAMVNYTAVIKLLKKRDKLTGASDQKVFMDEVMAAQPFAMYPGVAERVAQVEEIFGEIENMCFLRTGEGMKSVMKTELTVVEAILQLAQESEETQNRELLDETAAGPPPPPGFYRRRTLLQGPSAAGAGSGKQASGGRGRKATAEAVPAPATAIETAPAPAAASRAHTRATGEPSRAGAPAGEPSPSYLDGGRESAVGARRWEVASVAPGAAAPPPPRRPSGSGNKRTASSGGGGGGWSGDACSPPSVRVSVSSRVARPLPDTGADAPEPGALADGMVVSATGMVVSATKTPRLSTNAPRLSTTTASLGKGGGIVPKMARLG